MAAIDAALGFVREYRSKPIPTTPFPTPTSATPSGDGCICFEWRNIGGGDIVESVEFDGSGPKEYVRLESGKVVEIRRLPASPQSR